MRPNIPVVMYHTVNDHPEAHPLGFLTFSRDEFRQQLRFFRNNGYDFVTLDQLFRRALAGELGADRIAVLTFDDGFLDNFLVAADILREFDAVGTVFANPGHVSEGPARSHSELPEAWGYLNWEELRRMEASRVFDIQSHTMTHESVFRSDRIVDFYEPSKFARYHWLVWMLFPETLKQWSGDVYRFADRVPKGYPIFEFGRCLAHRAFRPSERFVERCCEWFQDRGGKVSAGEVPFEGERGSLESQAEWRARAEWQLGESKKALDDRLGKSVVGLCFPGGAYNGELLEMAGDMGYRLFMLSSRDQRGDNAAAIAKLESERLVGLKRVSFSKDYPSFLQGRRAAYWNAKLKVGTFMGDPLQSVGMRAGRAIRSFSRFFRFKRSNLCD